MTTRYPLSGGPDYAPVASGVVAALNASGDSDACEFSDWHVHTQVLNGMWKRVFVYDSQPVPSNQGVVSGAPLVAYSFLDVNYTVQVTEEKESASYCSGLYQPQQLIYFSDSTTGGMGLSGIFTTSAIGYTRRKWVKATDTAYNCQQTTNTTLAKLPGQYNPTFDTSGTTGSHIANLLMNCESACSRFSQSLVDY